MLHVQYSKDGSFVKGRGGYGEKDNKEEHSHSHAVPEETQKAHHSHMQCCT